MTTVRGACADVVVVVVTAPASLQAHRVGGQGRPSRGNLGERLASQVGSVAIGPQVVASEQASVRAGKEKDSSGV